MSWQNKLIRKKKFDSPVVEQTPIIWNETLYLAEAWHECWTEDPNSKACYVRIRNEQEGTVVAKAMHGFEYSSAFVWDDTIYIFAAGKDKTQTDGKDIQAIFMSSSKNMVDWTEPKLAVLPEEGQLLFNQSVCHDGNEFVMAYETDACVKFSIKFAKSSDLQNWQKVPDVVYGPDRYAACPAIRFVGGYYYMAYLEYLIPEWKFATYLTRSKDLITWEDAKHNPILSPDPEVVYHEACPEHGVAEGAPTRQFTQEALDLSAQEQLDLCPANRRECNASDIDFVEWEGKTRAYFTGGCQHWGGDLQMAEFDGSMQEFFESYYEE